MTCKVSVIIPFYNGIEYLRECVESVQNQTLREIEMLLIDDGSTDGSGALADELAKQDARIRVLHQRNRGVSAARNAALEIAQGAYIGFVDADDLAEPDMFAALYGKAVQDRLDIVSCAFSSFDANGIVSRSGPPADPGRIYSRADAVRRLPTMSTERTFQFIWRRLFSAALIRDHGVVFDPEISVGEDTLFCLECFLYAERTAAISDRLYRYRHQPNSALRSTAYKPNLTRALDKHYARKMSLCQTFCPEEETVFLRDSAERSIAETLPLALSNALRSPHGRYRAYRALMRTLWAQDTLRYASLPRSRSLDRIALRLMQKNFYRPAFCIAKLVFGKDKHNG